MTKSTKISKKITPSTLVRKRASKSVGFDSARYTNELRRRYDEDVKQTNRMRYALQGASAQV